MIELLYLFILFRIAKNNNFSIFKKHFQKSAMSLIEYVKTNFFQLNFSQSLINLSLVLFSVSFFSLPFPRSKRKVWDGRKFKRRRGLGGPLKFQRHELQKKFSGSRYLPGS